MDNLVEQVVKKEKNAKYYIRILIYVLVAILIPATLLVLALTLVRSYFITLSLFSALICAYGLWFFISILKIEYEYATLGGVLRVDKIIAKRNRKKIVKVDIKAIDSIFKYTDKEMSSRKFNKVYHVGAKEYSEDNFVITFVSDAKGKCAIVLTANEELLNSLKPFLKRDVYKDFFMK